MLSIKPIYRIQKIRRDGTVQLYLQYCHSPKKRTQHETGIIIPPRYWNKNKLVISDDLPAKYGQVQKLNQKMKLQIRKAEDIIELALNKKVGNLFEFIKTNYNPEATIEEHNRVLIQLEEGTALNDVKNNLDIFFQVNDYINSKKRKVSKDMIRIYTNMRDHLKDFEVFRKIPVTFESLDLGFYREWVDFLTYDYILKKTKKKKVGLKTNTVGKTIKQFLTFINDRVAKKIIVDIDYEGWKILEEEVDAIYLTPAEINKVYNLDFSEHPALLEAKTDFLLGCITGMRFSDFSQLMPEDMRDDLLYKKQQKSNHWVVIPLLKETRRILEERFVRSVQPININTFNDNIKELGKMSGIAQVIKQSYKKGHQTITETRPKYGWITSHTCRRSFCTNEYMGRKLYLFCIHWLVCITLSRIQPMVFLLRSNFTKSVRNRNMLRWLTVITMGSFQILVGRLPASALSLHQSVL